MANHQTSFGLTAEQKKAILAAQAELAKKGIKPSQAEVVRAALDAGLPILIAKAG